MLDGLSARNALAVCSGYNYIYKAINVVFKRGTEQMRKVHNHRRHQVRRTYKTASENEIQSSFVASLFGSRHLE